MIMNIENDENKKNEKSAKFVKITKKFNPLIPKDLFLRGRDWGALCLAKLGLFVDGVGNSRAACNREDMFIKNHQFCGINF